MTRGQAHLVLEWNVLPGQSQSIAAALQAVMLATRREAGCLGCAMSTSAAERVTLRYEEDWDTEENLRQQVRSDRFRVLATLVESAMETPRIEFVLPEGTRGIDYATEVREGSPRQVS